MPLEQRNYDPAAMAGASLSVQLDLGEILDANNNEVLEFDAVASAVNFVRIANSATGSRINISAQGDDTNVGMDLTPKGSGIVRFATATVSSITTGGAFDASGLSRTEVVFIVGTTTDVPVTVPGRTTTNTNWVKITAGGTTRFIQVYD